jgi:TetR/AcrR family transcriptional repressor of mexAB-oprM operon
MRKTKEDTEISKLRILLAAEEEFCQRGFVAANMDSIAKTAGLTKGAIFWHYKSKADLFKETIKRATARVKTIFQDAFSSSQPIMEKCRDIIKRVKRDRAFEILTLLSNSDIPSNVLKDCSEEISEIYKFATKSFNDAKKNGELRVDTDIRSVLVTITLIMSGFTKIQDSKSIIVPFDGHIDDEYVINAIFDGLLSFQNKE